MAKGLKRKVAKKSTHVELVDNKEKTTETIKGCPEDMDELALHTNVPIDKRLVSLSKGVTINLGNFQSARITCMVMSYAEDNSETATMNELAAVSDIIDKQIEYESSELDVE